MQARSLALATLCAAATLLAGCGTPVTVFDGRYPMRDGWHRAVVDRSVPDAELPALLRPACTDGPAAPPVAQWVIVDYRPAGRPRRAAVPVTDGIAPAGGTPVYLQIQGCQRALAPRPAASGPAG